MAQNTQLMAHSNILVGIGPHACISAEVTSRFIDIYCFLLQINTYM